MKRTVLLFGLLSAAVTVGLMALTLPSIDRLETETSDVIGYTSMALAALLVFFGVRSHRERVGDGRISFGRAVAVGLLISLVSTAFYALAFQVVYFRAMPQFGDRMIQCMVKWAEDAGKSPEEIEKFAQTGAQLKQLYDVPLTNAALIFATNLPLGLVAALISAAILRRTSKPDVASTTQGASP